MDEVAEYINGICRCWYCGEWLTEEEEEWPRTNADRSGELICDECYHEEFEFTCCRCENYDHIEVQHRMVVIFDPKEAGLNNMPSGVYEVVDHPYYTSDYISSWLNKWAVAYLGPLPRPKAKADYPCGHLCYDCQTPYVLIGDEQT